MPSFVSESLDAASADSTRNSRRCATPKRVRTNGSKPTSSSPQISFTTELYLPEPSPVKGSRGCQGLTRRSSRLRSEEHTSELQSRPHLVCRLLLEKKKKQFPILFQR